jgi:hypothetical protein
MSSEERETTMSTFDSAALVICAYNLSAIRFVRAAIASTWVAIGADHAGCNPRSLATTVLRVPMRKITACVRSSFAAASRIRSLKPPAKPCSAQKSTSPSLGPSLTARDVEVGRVSAGSKSSACPMAREITSLYASMPGSSDRPHCARDAAIPCMALTTASSCRIFWICATTRCKTASLILLAGRLMEAVRSKPRVTNQSSAPLPPLFGAYRPISLRSPHFEQSGVVEKDTPPTESRSRGGSGARHGSAPREFVRDRPANGCARRCCGHATQSRRVHQSRCMGSMNEGVRE